MVLIVGLTVILCWVTDVSFFIYSSLSFCTYTVILVCYTLSVNVIYVNKDSYIFFYLDIIMGLVTLIFSNTALTVIRKSYDFEAHNSHCHIV